MRSWDCLKSHGKQYWNWQFMGIMGFNDFPLDTLFERLEKFFFFCHMIIDKLAFILRPRLDNSGCKRRNRKKVTWKGFIIKVKKETNVILICKFYSPFKFACTVTVFLKNVIDSDFKISKWWEHSKFMTFLNFWSPLVIMLCWAFKTILNKGSQCKYLNDQRFI